MSKFNPIYTKNEIALIFYMNASEAAQKVWYSTKLNARDLHLMGSDQTKAFLLERLARDMVQAMGLPGHYHLVKAAIGLLKKVK